MVKYSLDEIFFLERGKLVSDQQKDVLKTSPSSIYHIDIKKMGGLIYMLARDKDVSYEQRLKYIEQFKNSGMSQEDFAKQIGVTRNTLKTWLEVDEVISFGVIDLTETFVEDNKTIFTSDKIRIELSKGFNKRLLKSIVEVLVHVK